MTTARRTTARYAVTTSGSPGHAIGAAVGRSISIHSDEELLAELREYQATPTGRAKLRERVKVEHGLVHVGQWQGRRARYRGTRKNLSAGRRTRAGQIMEAGSGATAGRRVHEPERRRSGLAVPDRH